MKIIQWLLSITIALILLQTLYFKFTGAEESIYIFTTIGMEPWGRYGSGLVELLASILVLMPRTRVFGALLAAGVMSGAIFFHLTSLGIEIMGDGGTLFYMGLLVLGSSIILLIADRDILMSYFKKS